MPFTSLQLWIIINYLFSFWLVCNCNSDFKFRTFCSNFKFVDFLNFSPVLIKFIIWKGLIETVESSQRIFYKIFRVFELFHNFGINFLIISDFNTLLFQKIAQSYYLKPKFILVTLLLLLRWNFFLNFDLFVDILLTWADVLKWS